MRVIEKHLARIGSDMAAVNLWVPHVSELVSYRVCKSWRSTGNVDVRNHVYSTSSLNSGQFYSNGKSWFSF